MSTGKFSLRMCEEELQCTEYNEPMVEFCTATPLPDMQMKEVGTSVDFAYCAGHNRKGDRCHNVVNKSICPFCDLHLQQGRKKLVIGARPECQGTVLGAVHGAQLKNPECLTKLAQRTPKTKKPQSLGAAHSLAVLLER